MQEMTSEAVNKERISNSAVVIVTALLVTSLSLNVLLARKISSLRLESAQLAASTRLQEGSSVPPIVGRALDGSPMQLRFEDVQVPTVIYVFSPQCGWCAKNIENLRALIAQSGPGYRIVGLSMTREDLGPYLSRERLAIPVFADVDSAIVSKYELGATPTTIVVSREGKVLKVWIGAYQEGSRREIEAFLRVRLLSCCEADAKRG